MRNAWQNLSRVTCGLIADQMSYMHKDPILQSSLNIDETYKHITIYFLLLLYTVFSNSKGPP